LKKGVVIEEAQATTSTSHTQETQNLVKDAPATNTTKINKVFFASSWKQATCSEQEFVLDVADKSGVEIESSCRAGTCGTCTAKILKGEVTYEENYDAVSSLEAGYILTCCAKPVSSVIIDA
jgi:ferredoxin-nitrite reductase